MNKKIEQIFKDAERAICTYQSSVADAFREYREAVATATEDYNETKLVAAKAAYAANARNKIKNADATLSNAVKGTCIPKLRNTLAEHVTERTDPEFISMLRGFKDFEIPLSRLELDCFVLAAGGNYSALRMLSAVAKHSGYTVSVPPIEDYEKDIAMLDQIAHVPIMYAPNEYLHEALELLPDVPVFRQDGSVAYTNGRPSSSYILVRSMDIQNAAKKLKDISTRWSQDFIPAINELKPAKADDGTEISPEQQRADAISTSAEQISVNANLAVQAQQMGVSQAEEDRRVDGVLSYYV